MCFIKKKKKENKVAETKMENVKEEKAKVNTKSVSSKKLNIENKAVVEKEEKTKKSIYRVVFSKENNVWQIKKDGAKRVIDSKPTKEEALARVKELSQSQDTKFIVHKKDGKFQKKANIR